MRAVLIFQKSSTYEFFLSHFSRAVLKRDCHGGGNEECRYWVIPCEVYKNYKPTRGPALRMRRRQTGRRKLLRRYAQTTTATRRCRSIITVRGWTIRSCARCCCRGRRWCPLPFRFQIFVTRQSKHVGSIFFPILQTTANERLKWKKKHLCVLLGPMDQIEFTLASLLTVGLFGNVTSVAFNIVFSSNILACDWSWPKGCNEKPRVNAYRANRVPNGRTQSKIVFDGIPDLFYPKQLTKPETNFLFLAQAWLHENAKPRLPDVRKGTGKISLQRSKRRLSNWFLAADCQRQSIREADTWKVNHALCLQSGYD